MSIPREPQGDHASPRARPPGLGREPGAVPPRPPGIFDVPGRGQGPFSQPEIRESGYQAEMPPQYETGLAENEGYARQNADGPLPEPGSFPPEGQLPPEGSVEEQPPARRGLRLLVTAMIAVFVLWILIFQVFVIRRVNVSGTSGEIWQTVAKAAGLDHSPFYFSVNEERVRQGVESNRYLIFQSMEKIIPGTVNIRVIQRKPYAFFTHLGVGYVLSRDGIILEQTRELRDGENLIKVVGLAVWGQQSPGSAPASSDPSQAETLFELFEELAVWDFDRQVDTIDIAETLNLTLRTVDGYTINLGNGSQLHAKVGTVASVVNELRRRQMTGGIIEATRPGEATYRVEQ